jgi:hypothetical protein
MHPRTRARIGGAGHARRGAIIFLYTYACGVQRVHGYIAKKADISIFQAYPRCTRGKSDRRGEVGRTPKFLRVSKPISCTHGSALIIAFKRVFGRLWLRKRLFLFTNRLRCTRFTANAEHDIKRDRRAALGRPNKPCVASLRAGQPPRSVDPDAGSAS